MKKIGEYTLNNDTITVNIYKNLLPSDEQITDLEIIASLFSIGENILEKTNTDIMINFNNYFVVAEIKKISENNFDAIVLAAGMQKNTCGKI